MAIHRLVRVHWDDLCGGYPEEFYDRKQCLEGHNPRDRGDCRQREREKLVPILANSSGEDVTEDSLTRHDAIAIDQ